MNFKHIGILICLLTTFSASPIPAQPSEQTEHQSLIFSNGVILTMDEQLPQAQAIAVQHSKVSAIGRNDEILALATPNTRLIDLHGLTLMPGFVDAHTHILNDASSSSSAQDDDPELNSL